MEKTDLWQNFVITFIKLYISLILSNLTNYGNELVGNGIMVVG
ncbi:MAG: hypothetical protein WBA54_03410 [Acidaminobacteraceae bacterium]